MSVGIFIPENYTDKAYIKECLQDIDLQDCLILEGSKILSKFLSKKNIDFETFSRENAKEILDNIDQAIFFNEENSFDKLVKKAAKKDIEIQIFDKQEDILYDDILKLQENYVNSENTELDLRDEEFDALTTYVSKRKDISLIGAKPKSDEYNLEYPMPSLDKISGKTALKKLENFMQKNKGPYSISSKVDGTSIQVKYEYNESTEKCKIRVFTGGDGITGREVSFLSEYVDFGNPKMSCVIRGELTMTEENFEKLVPKLQKEGLKAKNSRNLVNGMVNRKSPNKKVLKKCIFIAFSILSSLENISTQFETLIELGFEVPNPITVKYKKAEKFLEFLIETLEGRNENKIYRTDGLVISSNKTFYQNLENSNPTYSFAFKINTYGVTRVKKIKWNVTRYGYLTPVAIVEPVDILGTTMRKASAVHAKEVFDKGIGPGAIVSVTFSGDIIPKIESCIKKGIEVWPKYDCHWNDTEIELMVDNPENFPKITILQMNFFLKTLGVKDCGKKRLKILYDSGITKIDNLITMKRRDLEGLDGFRKTLSKKIIKQIKEAVSVLTWPKLMTATAIFGEGIGEERFQLVLNEIPDWMDKDLTADDFLHIRGIGNVLSEQLEQGFPKFKKWIIRNKNCIPQEEKEERSSNRDLIGQTIIFTGKRNANLEAHLKSRGATIKKSWVNSATIVVTDSMNSTSNKMQKAKEKGIKIYTIEKFMKKYYK